MAQSQKPKILSGEPPKKTFGSCFWFVSSEAKKLAAGLYSRMSWPNFIGLAVFLFVESTARVLRTLRLYPISSPPKAISPPREIAFSHLAHQSR
jgi:hypothetical protein